MAVKILDAGGGKVMLSSEDRSQVEAELQKYLAQGSKVIAVVAQVGGSWVAACTSPARVERIDDTQTLRLSDVSGDSAGEAGMEDDGLCRVESVGFKRIIRGPTRVLVAGKVDELQHFGAAQIGEIEVIDGEWTAMMDTAGAQNSGYRW